MNKKSSNIYDILITPLKIISVLNGDVMHAIKSSDEGYENFGEAYFSNINSGAIKAWKRHSKMILNLVVPFGKVKFVLYDDREKSKTYGNYSEVILSRDNFCRLTVPPMIWLGFQGLSDANSLILNIADIPHNPKESIRKDINEIYFDWSK